MAYPFSLLDTIVSQQFDMFPHIIEHMHPCDLAALACTSSTYRNLIYESTSVWRWMFACVRGASDVTALLSELRTCETIGGGQDASGEIVGAIEHVVTKLGLGLPAPRQIVTVCGRRFSWPPLSVSGNPLPPSEITFRELSCSHRELYQRAIMFVADRLLHADGGDCAEQFNDPRCIFQLERDPNVLGMVRFRVVARSIRRYFPDQYLHGCDVTLQDLHYFRYTRLVLATSCCPDLVFENQYGELRHFALDVLRLDRRTNGITVPIDVPADAIGRDAVCVEQPLFEHTLTVGVRPRTAGASAQAWLRIETLPPQICVISEALCNDPRVLVVRVPSIVHFAVPSVSVVSQWHVAAVIGIDRAWLTTIGANTPEVRSLLDAIDADPIATCENLIGTPGACWVCSTPWCKRPREDNHCIGGKCAANLWHYTLHRRKRRCVAGRGECE